MSKKQLLCNELHKPDDDPTIKRSPKSVNIEQKCEHQQTVAYKTEEKPMECSLFFPNKEYMFVY